jgi:hypothetical protein
MLTINKIKYNILNNKNEYIEFLFNTDKDYKISDIYVNNIFNRILKLKYKTIINYEIYHTYFNDVFNINEFKINIKNNCFKKLYNIIRFNKLIVYLIVDSIYCFFEIIKSINIYGFSFMMNYSFIYSIHKNLIFWLELMENYIIFYNENNVNINSRIKEPIIDINEKLRKTIDGEHLNFLSIEYHKKLSSIYLKKAIETHSEGKAYKEFIENMYYLNDDFNDRNYKFSASFERLCINVGKLQ